MFSPPISGLPQNDRQRLLDDLNYLNMAEIRSFCREHSIPYLIAVQTEDGSRRKTNEADRKGIVLNRIRHFLLTGEILDETCFPAAAVRCEPLPAKITLNDRLFYGQYDKANRKMITLLKDLTDGTFRDGAIARILAREFWTKGHAPSFKEFASAWLQAVKEHDQPNAEWAFLSDRARGAAGPDWKKQRAKKSAGVMRTLKQITRGTAE
jgi:hypothetical protein